MRRRDLAAGLAAFGMGPDPGPDPESIYIPRAQRVEDRAFLQDFMDEFAFADLVTSAPHLRITHLPIVLDRAAGKYGTLRGHISRHNPQADAFDGTQLAVMVFHGPDAYISPRLVREA